MGVDTVSLAVLTCMYCGCGDSVVSSVDCGCGRGYGDNVVSGVVYVETVSLAMFDVHVDVGVNVETVSLAVLTVAVDAEIGSFAVLTCMWMWVWRKQCR